MPDRVLIDTSILVDFRRNHSDASGYVMSLLERDAACLHPVAAAELLDGVRDRKDLLETAHFLQAFRRVAVKPADFEACLGCMSQFRLSHGIGWPDCLIAATALRLKLPVATLNDRHFRPFRGLKVIRPY
jgi:predicted nucleic acid-binding protein